MTGRAAALDTVPGLRQLAARQHRIVSRAQLGALGVTCDHVRSQVAAVRWRALGRHVVALQTGALSREQRAWVGIVHGGVDARSRVPLLWSIWGCAGGRHGRSTWSSRITGRPGSSQASSCTEAGTWTLRPVVVREHWSARPRLGPRSTPPAGRPRLAPPRASCSPSYGVVSPPPTSSRRGSRRAATEEARLGGGCRRPRRERRGGVRRRGRRGAPRPPGRAPRAPAADGHPHRVRPAPG